MIFTLLKLSIRALRSNMMRTLLTTLGIVVGISTVIIVLSVGEGVRSLILKQLSSIAPESLFIETQVPMKGTAMEKDSASNEALATGIQITTMKIRDVEDVLTIDNIASGYGMNIGQGKVTFRNREKSIMFYALQSTYPFVDNVQIAHGRFFTDQEDKGLSRVVVIGHDLKNILFGDEDPLGKNIKVNKINFKVVGVMEKLGMQMFMNMDEMVYLPLQTSQKLLLGFDHILYMALKMKDKNLINQTMFQIEKIMRRNHNIKDPEKDDFVIRTQEQAMDIINTVTGGISLLLFAIAAISLIVGGVGIMNVMYVTVTERTKEIGLKKSIGARPAIILSEFILESIILTLLGGIIGILWGVFISWGISKLAGLLSFDWPFVISYDGIIIAFCISTAIGLLFGYAPAKKAAKMNPIEALRYE